MPERDANTKEQHNEPRARHPWIPPRRQPRRQPWRAVLWAVMLVIALVALGWLVVNLYPDIWQETTRKRVATLIGIVVALTVIIVLLAFGGASLGWTGFNDKKLWDWLELLGTLAIPVVLAAAGFWFTVQQDTRQQKIETRRAEAEQKLAAQRAQDEALQTYLGQVGTLLLKEGLRSAEEGREVRTLARARTLTVLGRLGPDRKRTVIEFLYEASLINGDSPIIPLNNANMSGIDLSSRYLKDRRITGDPNLEGINLSGADLSEADLRSANLTQADLSGADLSEADLRLQDRLGRDVDQLLAVVDAFDPHAGRQNIAVVDTVNFLGHAFDGGHALFEAAHQHDALDDVVDVILAGNSQARLEPHLYGCHILDEDGIAADLRQHCIAQVVHRSDEADAAHDRGLVPRLIVLPPTLMLLLVSVCNIWGSVSP